MFNKNKIAATKTNVKTNAAKIGTKKIIETTTKIKMQNFKRLFIIYMVDIKKFNYIPNLLINFLFKIFFDFTIFFFIHFDYI